MIKSKTTTDTPITESLDQCFSTFLLQRNPHRREDHSRNPIHWSISLATYARLKLQGVYRLISLAGQSPIRTIKQSKMTDYDMKFDRISKQQYCIWPNTTSEAVVSGRLAPATNPENLSRGCL